MAFLPGLMSRLPMIAKILKPFFMTNKATLINAGVEAAKTAYDAIQDTSTAVMTSAIGQIQPSQVHATEDASISVIEGALKTLKITSLSLHSKQKLTQAEIMAMFLLINSDVSDTLCKEFIEKVAQANKS